MTTWRNIPWAEALIGLVLAAAVGVAIFAIVRGDPTGTNGAGVGRDYGRDVARMAQAGADRVLYVPAGVFDTRLADARSLAAGPNRRLVVIGDQVIRLYDLAATSAATAPAPVREVATPDRPRCVAVASDGTIYTGAGRRVNVYSADGAPRGGWNLPDASADVVAIAPGGQDVFVGDGANAVVLRMNRAGRVLGRIGETDERGRAPGLVLPSRRMDLAVEAPDRLWIANSGRHRLQSHAFDGRLHSWWGKGSAGAAGFVGCCNPVSFALLGGGGFVTCEKGVRRVKAYDAGGQFAGLVAAPGTFPAEPPLRDGRGPQRDASRWGSPTPGELDVTVDADGRVIVLDPYTGRIRIFVKKGQGD